MLLNMIMSASEVEPAKNELQKHSDDVKLLAEANIKMHSVIAQMTD
jgi:hypothetical protein